MLTQTQLGAKRHARTLASRRRRAHRRQLYGLKLEALARSRAKSSSYLLDLAAQQEKAKKDFAEAHRQALESRRTKAAIPGQPPKGAWNRLKSFFRRTP